MLELLKNLWPLQPSVDIRLCENATSHRASLLHLSSWHRQWGCRNIYRCPTFARSCLDGVCAAFDSPRQTSKRLVLELGWRLEVVNSVDNYGEGIVGVIAWLNCTRTRSPYKPGTTSARHHPQRDPHQHGKSKCMYTGSKQHCQPMCFTYSTIIVVWQPKNVIYPQKTYLHTNL